MSQITQGTGDGQPSPPTIITEAAPISAPSTATPELDIAEAPLSLERHHTEFAGFEEGYIARYIALADTKAAFVFAGASTVLVYLFNKEEIRAVAIQPEWSPACVLLGAGLSFLTIAATYAFATIVPRLATSGDGVVFFGAVAAHNSARDYLFTVANMSEEELAGARIAHCYDLARVCQRKYDALRRAMWCLLPGIVAAACIALLAD